MSRFSAKWACVLVGLVGAVGCKKPAPVTQSVASAKASAAPLVSATPSASAARLVERTPPPPPPRTPVPLDEAGVRTAKAYLDALGRGRKATVAKDYAQAEEQFSKCLELVPRDPRALAERGYARLLSEKVDEADADLAVAEKQAPSATLLSQILHNRMLVAKKRGDEKAVAGFEQAKKQLKAARRIDHGVSCSFAEGSSSLEAVAAASLDEALKLLVESHAKATQGDAAQIVFGGSGAETGDMTDVTLRALVVDDKLPDGGWKITTSSDENYSVANHALFARAGKLFVLPALSVGLPARCGLDGLASVRVGHGAGPWHVYREQSSVYPAYMCEFEDHSFAPCGTVEGKGEGTPVQSFCTWVGSEIQLDLLDSATFDGARQLSVSAQAGDVASSEPSHLLDYEWQPAHVAVTACGSRQQIPYATE